eukprot:TRINITY_DN68543_c0_g2_i4.p1 TRINITY_DN68543_c0_g2~~TRINITY_DN68543_c0_g2_i4.p1  ORF type:complete len:480 (-),score=45.87 TRINITY_DN68543_c0_g2_i4:54-1493(-)
MLKIRTLTTFVQLQPNQFEQWKTEIKGAAQFLNHATSYFNEKYTIQTVRISTNPFPQYVSKGKEVEQICFLENIVKSHGINFLSIGPASEPEPYLNLIPEILRKTTIVNCSYLLSEKIQNDLTGSQIAKCIFDISEHADNNSNPGLRDFNDMDINLTSVYIQLCKNFDYCINDVEILTISKQLDNFLIRYRVKSDNFEVEGQLLNNIWQFGTGQKQLFNGNFVSQSFRFCVAFNVKGGTPFFPASFTPLEISSNQLGFSIGTENSDFLYNIAEQNNFQMQLVQNQYEKQLQTIVNNAKQVIEDFKGGAVKFLGIDTSVCPSLEYSNLTKLIQKLNFGRNRVLGLFGTQAACERLTSMIQTIDIEPRIGYCGLMLPVCEEPGLAESVRKGDLNIQKLLNYSAVCGVGLDTVPIPGRSGIISQDIKKEIILGGCLADVSALAFKLNKPLSCRFLPMPRLESGEETSFSSPYMVNTRVLGFE